MSVWKAILVGELVVNLPAVAIMIAGTFLGAFIVPWPFTVLAGSLLAWI